MNDIQAAPPHWTPLQEAYIQKLYATYQANLYFLRQHFPVVFERLMSTELPAPFEVDGEARVTLYAGRFTGSLRDYTDLGRALFEQFEQQRESTRIYVTADYLESPSLITQHGSSPDFFRPIEHLFRGELLEAFRAQCPLAEDRHARPQFGPHLQPMVIVFGSGFGWHLDRLVDEYEIHNLVIVDTDVARLNLSLYFLDYVALHQRFAAQGRSFSVALHEDNELLAASVLSTLQRQAPPYAVQGAALFFHDYDSEVVQDLWRRISKDLGKLFRGWGFFDDEILGLKHAVENYLARRPTFVGGQAVPEEAEVIVVGAGPSLDTLLPQLREARERVVLISCGSALSALAKLGIEVDFHLEIERTAQTFRVLDTPLTRDVLAHTPLLASAIMAPEVYGLSAAPAMFLKELDFGSNALDFGKRLPRIRTNPTCTNGGLDFVLQMGFRKLYLFGVDLGYLPEGKHHSASSMYYQNEAAFAQGEIANIIAGTHWMMAQTHAVAGNLCETVLSTEQFIYSRDVMQVSIADHPQATVINPNNGARIAGAHSVAPQDLRIGGSVAARKAAVAAIRAAFFRDMVDDMRFNLGLILKQYDAVLADLGQLFSQPITRKADLFLRLAQMHEYFFTEDHQQSQVFPLMRGSMLHMGRFAYDCFSMMRDEVRVLEFGRFSFDLFLRFLSAGRDNIAALEVLARSGKLPDRE